MRTDRIRQLAAAAILLAPLWTVFVLWVPATLHQPLGRDQGIFSWAGSVLLRGGLPFADAWEVKGPATHASYALALLLFGHSEVAVRLFDVMMWMVAGIIFISIGRRINRGVLSGLLALPLLLCVQGGDYWYSAQPDQWAGVILAAAVLPVLPSPASARRYAISGALIGLASLFKPPYALFIVVIALGALQDKESLLRRAAWLAAGMAAPIIATVLIYAANHQLAALWDVLIRFNLQAHAHQHGLTPQVLIDGTLAYVGLKHFSARSLLPALALLSAVVTLRTRRKAGLMLVAALPITFLIALAQNKFYIYHFLPYWIIVVLAVSLGIDRLVMYSVNTWRSALAWTPAVIAVAVLVVFLAQPPYDQALLYWNYAAGQISPRNFERSFGTPDFSNRDTAVAAAYLKENTKPADTVYLWGFDALLYFLADRQAPTRFGFNYPMLVDVPEHRERERAELLRDLRRRPPAFVIVQRRDANNLMPLSSDQYLLGFPELQQFIAEGYEPRISTSRYDLYQSKTESLNRVTASTAAGLHR